MSIFLQLVNTEKIICFFHYIMEQNLKSPQSDDECNKRRKTSHQYLEHDGVIYIDITPTQSKPGDIIHNLDEETATLIDAQEELNFYDDDEDDFDEDINDCELEDGTKDKDGCDKNFWNTDSPVKRQQNVSASPVTVPHSRRVAFFPPNWRSDDSTASLPEIDFEDDDDSLTGYDLFDN